MAHQAGAYPGFRSMKRLGVFLLLPGWDASPMQVGERRGGLMVSVLDSGSERSGFEPLPGTLCCVLGQDTLLSQCLSPPRCING